MMYHEIDVIIGTDVVFWPMIIKPLVKTLNLLFAKNPNLVFYICYIERHTNTHNQLKEELLANQFQFTELSQEFTKPLCKDAFIYKIVK